jgi:hypothetical protein
MLGVLNSAGLQRPLGVRPDRETRNDAKAARDAEIIRLKDEGLSNREIGREVGVDKNTVRAVIGGEKENTSDIPQTGEIWAEPPIWKQKLTELTSDPAQNWASALRALRHINEQVPVDNLFTGRFGIG